MSDTTPGREGGQLTRPERWAAYAASTAGSPWWSLVLVAMAVVGFALSLDAAFIVLPLFVALLYWERAGFKRLLTRRDAEIERLRSSGGSA